MHPHAVTPCNTHQKPWLSVIVATRNRVSLLETALKGIQSQTFQNYEVIVVDDGSSEATRSQYPALSHLLGERFKFELLGWSDQPGYGPSVARNFGINLSQGQVICFCDDDDYWFNFAHLAMMFSVFSSMPELDMYIANQRAVCADGVIQRADWLPLLCKRLKSRQCQHEYGYVVSVEDLSCSGGFAHVNILAVRRDVVEQIQGFWERIGYEEDRDFFWRAVDCCQHIFFNPAVVAQHNIPDAKKQDNQSTARSWMERWMLSTLVSQHISASVRNVLIATLAVSYEGDINRKLSTQFIASGQTALAWQFGKRALATRWSFKWAGYLLYLKFQTYLVKVPT